ncbi:MAG: chorismate-binding protein, partial [Planctomycetota bacterium]
MPHRPEFTDFASQADGADYVPVYRRLVSDTLTPVTGFHHLAGDDGEGGAVACLFESVIGGEKVGRYSFVASDPFLLVEARGNQVTETEFDRFGEVARRTETNDCDNPLELLREAIGRYRVAPTPGLPPFVGGAVGYAGYDTVRYVEHLPHAPEDDRDLPDLSFAFFDHMVVFDNVQKTVTVIALADVARVAEEKELRGRYEDACARGDALVAKLTDSEHPLAPTDIDTSGGVSGDYPSNFTQPEFEAAVEKCVEYIRAGDIFQVVLSQRLAAPLEADPFEVYRTLRVVNPSPFMFYLRT